MEHHHVGAGIRHPPDPALRSLDHQMDLERHVDPGTDLRDEQLAERGPRNEVTVHHIEREGVDARVDDAKHLVPQAREVGVEDRGRDDRHGDVILSGPDCAH
jgi:hypothetical protein